MTRLTDMKWFCPQPFVNSVVNIDGSVQPCCVLKDFPQEKGIDSVEKAHHSSTMKAFRKEFLVDEGPTPMIDKHCSVCVEQERHGDESHRRSYLSKFYFGVLRKYRRRLEEYVDTDHDEQFVLSLEYKAPNNFCNLRCNMCCDGYSSARGRESEAIGEPVDEVWYKRDDDPNKFTDTLKTVDELKLVGAETLAIRANYVMMDHVIDLGIADRMHLTITTNGTMLPKLGRNGTDITDYVPRFRSCQINVSVECWGEKNDYIRFPSKWDTIMKNVRVLSKIPGVKILFVSCISSLNVGYLHEVADGVDALIEREPDVYNSFSTGSLVLGDSFYTVASVPDSIRERYLDAIFENARSKHSETFMKITSILTDIPFDPILHEKMMVDVRARDIHRGTCLIDVFPEWEPYYGLSPSD